MPIDVEQLIRDARSGEYQSLIKQMGAWVREGTPMPGPVQWLSTVESGEDRKHGALVMAHIAADHGNHQVMDALAKAEDPLILASLVEPYLRDGMTPAQRAGNGRHVEVIEALAGSHDPAVRASLTVRHHTHKMSPAQWAATSDHAGVVEALARTGDPDILRSLTEVSPADGYTSAQRAMTMQRVEVIAALARCNHPAVLASLVARHPSHRQSPAQWATTMNHAGVVEAMAGTGNPDLLRCLAEPGLDHFTTALRAAHSGNVAIIEALARTRDPDILRSLAARHRKDGFSPAQRAVVRGHAGVIEALARTGDPGILRSLAEPHPRDQSSPGQKAAQGGMVEVIEALAEIGDEAVWNSLRSPHPLDGLTPEARARQKGHADAADAVRDAVAVPYDERAVLKKAQADLETALEGSAERRLAAELQCPISFVPFATAGSRRPVHLNLSLGHLPQRCVSEHTANALAVQGALDPFGREPFDGVVEAKDRVSLIAEVADAYRQNPADLQMAREVALGAYAAYEQKVADAVPHANAVRALPAAVRAERAAARASVTQDEYRGRTDVARAESAQRDDLGVHYRDILARPAGAGAGARARTGEAAPA